MVPAVIACAGIVQSLAGLAATVHFAQRLSTPVADSRPPITILKPLCGDEPLLADALASLCAIDYPAYQLVFGVQDPADPAIAVVERLRVSFPAHDITLVVDPTPHGANRKISNLINMLSAARHDVLVVGDSDVHVMPNYLDCVAHELAQPGAGLVTTLYAGLPPSSGVIAMLGATNLSHQFLPGALMARWLGRQDTLGVTMALRRETLTAIGGFEAIVDHLADDHVLGNLVQAQGLSVRLARTLTTTTVPEKTLSALFQHELRWSRTVLSLVPISFALSAIQFPLFWAALAAAVSGAATWAICLFLIAWIVRAGCAVGIDRALGLSRLGLSSPPPLWLMPMRDILSMVVMFASYGGDQVEWRGHRFRTRHADDVTAPLAKIGYAAPSNAPAATAG